MIDCDFFAVSRPYPLMCLWSVPRRQWAHLLGRTAAEFDARLDVLLTIHASAALRPEELGWVPHWVHLPKRELGMRRPLDVMIEKGEAGMAVVLDLVWTDMPAQA